MKAYAQSGFTIIETMLFLSISGLLAIALLAGVGTSINLQRYHDSVFSLQSKIQQIYTDVANTYNNRGNNWNCDSSGLTEVLEGAGTMIGQSDCVILGKFITSSSDGTTLLAKDIIGTVPSSVTSATNDLEALKASNIRVSTVSVDSYPLEWGASVVNEKSDNVLHFSTLILRSPSSGLIRTLTNATIVEDSDVAVLLNPTALTTSIKLCINSNGLFTGPRMAVKIDSNSTGTGGVETMGANSGC